VLREGGDAATARNFIRQLCRERLQAFMIPVKTKFVDVIPQSHRLKRVRSKS
jgi:acyl-coenzyme A synthetase/AMP-(fatty) acid ligase